MTFQKILGPNGTEIIMVLEKAGLRQGAFWYETGGGFWRLLVRKGCPKGSFLKIMKIKHVTKINLFPKDRHLDPLETIPGSGLEWFRTEIVIF